MNDENKITLIVLAAGMASRYGGNKQTDSFGPAGETIMEYSIHDAIKVGFRRVIFIIRKDSEILFKAQIEPKIQAEIEIDYAYQSLESFSNGVVFNKDRVKPFGTAHALLCCKGKIDSPFAVINADDFYGLDAFMQAYSFLKNNIANEKFACLGYALENTVSEYGAVTRGLIDTNSKGEIMQITERTEILLKNENIVSMENGIEVHLDKKAQVSMNFFCFKPNFVDWLENEYYKFLEVNKNELKAEFLIPEVADILIQTGKANILMIPTDAKWFGVTFKEDAEVVKTELNKLTEAGLYPKKLWED